MVSLSHLHSGAMQVNTGNIVTSGTQCSDFPKYLRQQQTINHDSPISVYCMDQQPFKKWLSEHSVKGKNWLTLYFKFVRSMLRLPAARHTPAVTLVEALRMKSTVCPACMAVIKTLQLLNKMLMTCAWSALLKHFQQHQLSRFFACWFVSPFKRLLSWL